MKISIQSHPLTSRVPREKVMEMIAAAGFESVDFGISDYAGWNYMARDIGSGLFDKSEKEIFDFFRPFASEAAAAGLTVGQTHAPFPCNTFEGTPAVTEKQLRISKQSVIITALLGCDRTVIHPCFRVDDFIYDDSPEMRRQTRKLNDSLYIPLIPVLKEYGVKLCVENMWAFYPGTEKIAPAVCSHPDEMISYIDGYNEIAGQECFCACLDVGHAVLTGDDPADFIRRLGSRLQAVHLHDVIPDHDLHHTPYEGVVDWDSVMDALGATGYCGTLNFETLTFLEKRPAGLFEAGLRYEAEVARFLRSKLPR